MKPMSGWPSRCFALLEWAKQFRYIKFGLVGASGTVVNIAILYISQELLFAFISAPKTRLYASLALAITVATVNNFTWNRLWTWADRLREASARNPQAHRRPNGFLLFCTQFGRYALASWLGIALQYGLTLWLAHSLHYMVANVIAILIASVSNFLANDRWTFRR
jgi:dolichol-phosphate mannosyltransferase